MKCNTWLRWLDFHARMAVYPAPSGNPTIARWHVPDPLAQQFASHTPYSYCMGNPVNFIDPTGMAPEGGDYRPWYWNENVHGQWTPWKNYRAAMDMGMDSDTAWDISFGDGSFGLPGRGGNGSGALGVYYDWHSGTYRSSSSYTPMSWQQAFNEVILPNGETYQTEAEYWWSAVGVYDGDTFIGLAKKSEGWRIKTTLVSTPLKAGFGLGELSVMSYWLGTINNFLDIHHSKNLTALEQAKDGIVSVTRKIPGRLANAIKYEKSFTAVTRTASKGLFVVGVALSVGNIIQNPTTENIVLGIADSIMGGVSIFCPVVGIVYFTGMMVYDIIKEN